MLAYSHSLTHSLTHTLVQPLTHREAGADSKEEEVAPLLCTTVKPSPTSASASASAAADPLESTLDIDEMLKMIGEVVMGGGDGIG